jgi:hypothetical protein
MRKVKEGKNNVHDEVRDDSDSPDSMGDGRGNGELRRNFSGGLVARELGFLGGKNREEYGVDGGDAI